MHMTIELCGVNLYYERSGSGKPLLLLHGWGCKCDSFLPIARDFASRREIIALDFPGHGRSGEPPEPWSVTEYAELTAAFIERMGIAGADIIAHSFGGRVSILLAATRPELLGKLVLTGCAGLPPRATKRRSMRSRLYKVLRFLAGNALSRAVLGAKRVDALREGLIQKFGSADYRALTPSMRPTFNRVIAQDLTPYLEKVRASTLLIWGENDFETPLWMGQEMAKRIPDAGLVVFPGCGHYAYLDQYGRFRAICENFLL